MDEAKRVVVENYPAGKLPDDVRGDIDPAHRVRVTVEDADAVPDRWEPFFRRLEAYHRSSPRPPVTTEEAVARVRALRDEWD